MYIFNVFPSKNTKSAFKLHRLKSNGNNMSNYLYRDIVPTS